MSDMSDEEVEREFHWMMLCDRSLDDVMVKLAAVGLSVDPRDRVVVNRWLDLFSANSPIPLGHRLEMLSGMLESASSKRV